MCCAGHGDGSCLAHLCVVLVMMLGLVTGPGLRFVSVPLDHPAAFGAADLCSIQFSFSFLCIRDWEE